MLCSLHFYKVLHFDRSRRFPYAPSQALPSFSQGNHYFDFYHHRWVLSFVELYENGLVHGALFCGLVSNVSCLKPVKNHLLVSLSISGRGCLIRSWGVGRSPGSDKGGPEESIWLGWVKRRLKAGLCGNPPPLQTEQLYFSVSCKLGFSGRFHLGEGFLFKKKKKQC